MSGLLAVTRFNRSGAISPIASGVQRCAGPVIDRATISRLLPNRTANPERADADRRLLEVEAVAARLASSRAGRQAEGRRCSASDLCLKSQLPEFSD